ncbi:MAG TPA: hypothetical protein VHQ39_00755 [Dongiaceae bacterium]|nr:hypothetical protein [Dongiaceae bacterium]
MRPEQIVELQQVADHIAGLSPDGADEDRRIEELGQEFDGVASELYRRKPDRSPGQQARMIKAAAWLLLMAEPQS